jgi:pimeloyl-ACP methyl ester carboxylesterase
MAFVRTDRNFNSGDLVCAAWLYLPDGAGAEAATKPPIVVMGHGFAAERTFRLPAYAECFADAGIAVLLFDYRNIGDSEGMPRGLVDPSRHVEDWRAAVAHVRSLPEVDGNRVGLWGSSFSGGHVIVTAAKDSDIKAVVAQVPFVGGIEIDLPLRMKIQAGASVVADKIASLFGGAVHVPVVGAPDRFAILMAEEAEEYVDLVPDDSQWRNEVPARVLLQLEDYDPRSIAPNVHCPALFVVGERDETTPPELVKACAATMPAAEVAAYDCGHFSVYVGKQFEEVVVRERDFLVRHLLGDPN